MFKATSPNHAPAYPHSKYWSRLLIACQMLSLGLGMGIGTLVSAPAVDAAEEINVTYGVLGREIPVKSLVKFAETGKVDEDMSGYASYASEADLANFRRILNERVEISNVLVARFLYTSQGEKLLEILGEVIKSGPGLSGNKGIRAALILAASDRQNGLTLLNFFKKYPTNEIYMDIAQALDIVGEVSGAVDHAQRANTFVAEEAARQAALELPQAGTNEQPIDLAASLTDLSQPGKWRSQRYELTASASSGNYEIPFYLYVPDVPASQSLKLVVVYPGLGSTREPFEYLAEHLASYGYAVALSTSPGSDASQLEALLVGASSKIAPPKTFLQRPQDISDVLDEIDRLRTADERVPGNIDLKNVGMVGHSFGGYAALALVSDGQINFAALQEACQGFYRWNVSMSLQCVAQGLPRQEYDLSDDRIKAVIAMNQIDSAVLGKTALSAIEVPVMFVAGSVDTIAPALEEQIRPFTWLNAEQKYLLLMENASHLAVTTPTGDIPPDVRRALAGADTDLGTDYMKTFSVAFFQTYIAGKPDYVQYLTSAYAQSRSQEPYPLGLLRSLTPEQLQQGISQTTETATN
jgi:predicted dienelactone hydrolase